MSTNITERVSTAKLALQWNFSMKRSRSRVELEEAGGSSGSVAHFTVPGTVSFEKEVEEYCISLTNAQYERDKGPLVTGCQCHACTHHTRQYIYHLLKAKELLGELFVITVIAMSE